MGNLAMSIKKAVQSKNIVTLIGMVLVIGILYYCYNWRIQSSIQPITVPYAKVQISAATQITESMIGERKVPPSMVTGGAVLTTKGEIIDKYSAVDTIIPKGSLFYDRSVVEKEQLPNSIIFDYPSGYVLYNLPVDISSSYFYTIKPGDYIDIYAYINYKYTDPNSTESGGLSYGKIISNVKVLAIKDSSGQSVFRDNDERGIPAMMIFALPNDLYEMLRKASYMRTYDTKIEIKDSEATYKDDPGEVTLVNDKFAEFVRNNTAWAD